MLYFVDRIEDGVAVCETPKGIIIHVPSDTLPLNAREGSVLREKAGSLVLDEAAAIVRRTALLELQESLLEPEDDA